MLNKKFSIQFNSLTKAKWGNKCQETNCLNNKIFDRFFNQISDANWGSSAQALQFVSALKNVQALNDVPDHVKNYRPKILVLSGVPAHRQPLVDFANLLTKKLSLLVCAHVEQVKLILKISEDGRPQDLDPLRVSKPLKGPPKPIKVLPKQQFL